MTSAIPAATAALVTVWTSAVPGTDVRDAWTLSGDTGSPTGAIWSRVHVGWIPDSETATGFHREWHGIGGRRMDETFNIPCLLECVSGDEDLTALRSAAFDLLDDLSSGLAADLTLGGLVETAAVMNDGELTLHQDDEGARVGIRFLVACESIITA